jgi:hypothetical protein
MDSYEATGTHSCMSVLARNGHQVVEALAFGFEYANAIVSESIAPSITSTARCHIAQGHS